MSCRGPIIVYPPCAVPECPDITPVELSNGNLAGEGVLDSFVGQTGVFRGITGDGTYISTSLNAGNKAIVISFDDTAVAGAVPQATETVAGKGEVATQAETNAGTSDTTFITPLKLATRAASTTLSGVVELATSAETVTGIDATRAVTPNGLSFRLASQKVTQTFANAAARGAAQPAFDGQLGVQLDTEMVYTATGLAAGDWQQSFIQPNTTTTFSGATEFAIAGNSFIISDGATDHLRVEAGVMQFDGEVDFLAASSMNLITGFTLAINSVTVPANSVLITSATAGRPSSKLISDFISTSNKQTGWSVPTGTLSRLSLAAYDGQTVSNPPTQIEVQSIDDAVTDVSQRLAALITDIMAQKLPAA